MAELASFGLGFPPAPADNAMDEGASDVDSDADFIAEEGPVSPELSSSEEERELERESSTPSSTRFEFSALLLPRPSTRDRTTIHEHE